MNRATNKRQQNIFTAFIINVGEKKLLNQTVSMVGSEKLQNNEERQNRFKSKYDFKF